jgi:hypothetical protein
MVGANSFVARRRWTDEIQVLQLSPRSPERLSTALAAALAAAALATALAAALD